MTNPPTPPARTARSRPRTQCRHALVKSALALLLIAGLAPAQPAATPPAAAPEEAPASEPAPATHTLDIHDAPLALRMHIADQLVRSARRRLHVTQDPQPVEYRAAAEVVAAARALVPPDADLLRLEIEARAAGLQDEHILPLTRELLKLEPDDEIAQLRLAVGTVKRRQTTRGRLEAYELLLGPRGVSLRDAVRSRLAVDAALLAREQGSERMFIEYITYATTADPSNKAAAALYASHFMAMSDDPLERVDMLTNIVLADPLDPEALQNLALEMVQHGAYEGAFHLLTHTVELYNQRREQLPLRLRIELTLAEWNTEGTDHLIDYAGDLEETLRHRIAGDREYAIEQGLDPGPEQQPLLPLELEALRLAAAVVKRDEEMQRRMLEKCIAQGMSAARQFLENTPDPEQGRRRADTMRLTLLWCRFFAGQDTEALREELAYFTSDEAANPIGALARQRFEGWLALIEGDVERAREVLEPLVDRDRHAKWAMGVLEERHGSERDALRHYAGIAQRYPNTAIGTAAWFRAQELHGGELVRSPEAERISREGVKLVEWLTGEFPSASRYMAIEATHVDPPISPMGGGEVEITVRNRTSWPLAVGEGRPIPRRVLATPVLTFGTADLVDATRPETVDVPGRLRLSGNEEITFRVRPMRRLVGDVFDVASVQRSTARWQTTLGFNHDGRRATPAAYSVSAQTRLAGVTRLPADEDPQTILDAIESTSGLTRAGNTRAALIASAPRVMEQLGMDRQTILQRRTQLLNGVAALYPTMSEGERTAAMLAFSMPMANVTGEDMNIIRAALNSERSLYVAAAIAATGSVSTLDSPVFDILKDAGEPWARGLALHLADAIRIRRAIERTAQDAIGG